MPALHRLLIDPSQSNPCFPFHRLHIHQRHPFQRSSDPYTQEHSFQVPFHKRFGLFDPEFDLELVDLVIEAENRVFVPKDSRLFRMRSRQGCWIRVTLDC
jgi:hypothetical protein